MLTLFLLPPTVPNKASIPLLGWLMQKLKYHHKLGPSPSLVNSSCCSKARAMASQRGDPDARICCLSRYLLGRNDMRIMDVRLPTFKTSGATRRTRPRKRQRMTFIMYSGLNDILDMA